MRGHRLPRPDRAGLAHGPEERQRLIDKINRVADNLAPVRDEPDVARADADEIIPPKFPRKPLKRLDSDERIQGNPSFSNPHKRGFSPPNGPRPRNPKPIDRTEHCGPRSRRTEIYINPM